MRVVAFDPDLLREVVDPCFDYKVGNGGYFKLLVHVDEYTCAFLGPI